VQLTNISASLTSFNNDCPNLSSNQTNQPFVKTISLSLKTDCSEVRFLQASKRPFPNVLDLEFFYFFTAYCGGLEIEPHENKWSPLLQHYALHSF